MQIIGNAHLVTLSPDMPFLEDGAVAIDNGRILKVGTTDSLRKEYPNAAFTDAKGGLLTPGLINLHSHLYSAFALGMPYSLAPSRDFNQVLERVWWRLDQALDLDGVRYSAVAGLLDAARLGITTLVDHHASPRAIDGSLDAIADGYETVGLRGLLCYEITDRHGLKDGQKGLDENIRFARRHHPLLKGMIGMHASFTIGEETMQSIIGAAKDLSVGIHVHAAEAASDVQHAQENYGMHPVARMQELLGPKSLLAHGVHLKHTALQTMIASGATLVHNPSSNLNNAVGIAPVVDYIRQGLPVGIGTDGLGQDILTETKNAQFVGKYRMHDPSAWSCGPAALWRNSARFVSRYFDYPVGIIESGAAADLVLWNYNPPCPMTKDNWEGHFTFGLHSGMADCVWVAGRLILAGGEPQCDHQGLMNEARGHAKKTWERLESGLFAVSQG